MNIKQLNQKRQTQILKENEVWGREKLALTTSKSDEQVLLHCKFIVQSVMLAEALMQTMLV